MEEQNHIDKSNGFAQLKKHIGTTAYEMSKPFKSIRQEIEEGSNAYLAIPTCVFEVIIGNSSIRLSALERIFYLIALTHYQLNKARAVEMSAEVWAKYLGIVDCDAAQLRSKILRVQGSLERKGFLQVTRRKNVRNRHMRNKITPLIPDTLYQILQNAPSRCSEDKQQKLKDESNLDWIIRTKLFVPIKYDYLKQIFQDLFLSHSCKLFLMHNYIFAYKNYQNIGTLSRCATIGKLATNYSHRTVLKWLQILGKRNSSFVKVERKYIYHNDYDTNTCDKPVYKFTFDMKLLPASMKTKDKVNATTDQQDKTSASPTQHESFTIVEGNIAGEDTTPTTIADTGNTTLSSKSVSINLDKELKLDKKLTTQTDTKNSFNPHRTLKSYYPLSQGEVDSINKKSHRDFSLNFANQLLLKLISKYPHKTFPTWYHFNSYMIKAFKYELHQSTNVNRQSFRFRCNIANESAYTDDHKIERYLAQIEHSCISTQEAELRCKIANVFKPKTAYAILSNVDFFDRVGTLIIKFSRDISLSPQDEATLMRETRAVYGGVSIDIQYFNHDSSTSCQLPTTDLSATTPSSAQHSSNGSISPTAYGIDMNSPCYEFRLGIIERMGLSAYKSWFADVKIVLDKDNRKLELIMPTAFSAHWIHDRYDHIVYRLSSDLGFAAVQYSSAVQNKT